MFCPLSQCDRWKHDAVGTGSKLSFLSLNKTGFGLDSKLEVVRRLMMYSYWALPVVNTRCRVCRCYRRGDVISLSEPRHQHLLMTSPVLMYKSELWNTANTGCKQGEGRGNELSSYTFFGRCCDGRWLWWAGEAKIPTRNFVIFSQYCCVQVTKSDLIIRHKN